MIENKYLRVFFNQNLFKLCTFSTFSTVQNKIILDTISILSLPFQCAFTQIQKERKKKKTKYMPTRNFILYNKILKNLPFKSWHHFLIYFAIDESQSVTYLMKFLICLSFLGGKKEDSIILYKLTNCDPGCNLGCKSIWGKENSPGLPISGVIRVFRSRI